MHGDKGAMVCVWRGLGAGREGDFQSEDGFVRRIENFVFIKDFEGGKWGAGGDQCLLLELIDGRKLTLGRRLAPPCLQPLRTPFLLE